MDHEDSGFTVIQGCYRCAPIVWEPMRSREQRGSVDQHLNESAHPRALTHCLKRLGVCTRAKLWNEMVVEEGPSQT
jgi:hypothetical protein